MKKAHMLSVFTALSVMLSMVPFVNAAGNDLSDFEGQTIICQVVDVTEDGVITSSVDVSIPEGATKAQEDALIYAAIGEDTSANEFARVDPNHPDFLAEIQNPEITDLPGTLLYDGNLPRTYQRILVDITVTKVIGVSKLYVDFRNQYAGSFQSWTELDYERYPQRVIFRCSDGLIMNAGNHVEIRAYANPGTIIASYAQVAGSPIAG